MKSATKNICFVIASLSILLLAYSLMARMDDAAKQEERLAKLERMAKDSKNVDLGILDILTAPRPTFPKECNELRNHVAKGAI